MHALALLLQAPPNPEMMRRIFLMMMPLFFVFYLVAVALVMVPFWFICKKAGFSPWISLACLFPSLGMLVLLYVLAFADWKVVPAPPQAYWPPPPYQPPAPPPAPPPVAPQV